jgi:prepilin-type N-terminal cleavage/methylation domain-containing protein
MRIRHPRCHAEAPRRRRGFTLIETAMAIVVIGVGVLAMLAAQVAFHEQNRWSTHASRAMFLANEIRETMTGLPLHDPVIGLLYDPETNELLLYDPETNEPLWGPEPQELSPTDWDDLDDFDGAVFSADAGTGPIDASRRPIAGLDGWSQRVRVVHVEPWSINVERPPFSTRMVQVEVVVTYRHPGSDEEQEMTRLSWLAP